MPFAAGEKADPAGRGVLVVGVLVLLLGLPGAWLAPWMPSTKTDGVPSQERVVQVEVKGPYALEGIHDVPPGTPVGAFLRGLGAGRERWGGPSEVWERPIEEFMAISLVDGSEGSQVQLESMSPGRTFLLGGVLDLNRAGVRDLGLLPGIGPATARKIAMERRLRGRFESAEDLRRIRGIPSRVLERILPLVMAQGGKELRETRNPKHEIRNDIK